MGWERGSKRQSEVQSAGRGEVRDKAKCNGLGGGEVRDKARCNVLGGGK